MRIKVLTLSVLLTVALVSLAAGAATVSPQQADVFLRKVAEISKPNPPAIKPGMRRTPVSEGEVNSWFTYRSSQVLPPGVSNPQLTLIGQGKVAGRAIVDLDAVSKRRASGSMFDPWNLVGGRVPVTVVGVLRTTNGVGRFDVESADVSGVPVPKVLLQELVSYYSRTSQTPNGVRLDDPFPLPAAIQQIEIGQGRAVIVQ
jgi:hypothetical protein